MTSILLFEPFCKIEPSVVVIELLLLTQLLLLLLLRVYVMPFTPIPLTLMVEEEAAVFVALSEMAFLLFMLLELLLILLRQGRMVSFVTTGEMAVMVVEGGTT